MKRERPKFYVLRKKQPFAVDLETWGREFEKADRRVAHTEITQKVRVSTVFLGLDHNWCLDGDPLLFETLVFGGPLDGDMYRYSTWKQAEAGHKKMVAAVRVAVDKIQSLKDSVGAT